MKERELRQHTTCDNCYKPAQRHEFRQSIIATLRDWPKLMRFLEAGDLGGHPDQLVDELVNAVESVLKAEAG